MAKQTPADGEGITIAGWGNTETNGYPDYLQYAEVNVISKDTCNSAASYDGEVLDGMICMGYMKGGVDTCQGDSGGPAYVTSTGEVAGITSWGYGCADLGHPGVYTDVAYFKDWIAQNM